MLLNPALRPPTERANALRWAMPRHRCAAWRVALLHAVCRSATPWLLFWLLALLALPAGNTAWAQTEAPPAATAAATPPMPTAMDDAPVRRGIRFELVVQAPAPLDALLQRHLDIQRFHDLPDLDAGELRRLVQQLPADASNLLGTQGHFSPTISTQLQAPETDDAPWRVRVDVEPGPVSHIGQVVLALGVAPPPQTAQPQATEAEPEPAPSAASHTAVTAEPPPTLVPAPAPDSTALGLAEQRMHRQWPLTTGQPFSQTAWDEAKAQALRSLSTESFLNARLTNSLADVNTDTHTVNLAVELDTGPAFTLGPVQIEGLARYEAIWMENLVRAAGVAPGQPYRLQDLQAAQQRLAQSGYFDSVFVYVDPDTDPNAAPVQIQAREARLGRLRLGVGISTDSGPRLSAEHTWNRVPGLDWRANSQFKLETDNPNLTIDLRSPTDGTGWQWNTRAVAERLTTGLTRTTSQQLRLGRLHESEVINRNVYVQYDRSLTDSPALRLEGDLQAEAALSGHVAWSRNRFVGMPTPSHGHGLAVEAGVGITLGHVRKPFVRTHARWQGLLPLDQDWAQLWPTLVSSRPIAPQTGLPSSMARTAKAALASDPTASTSDKRHLGRLALRLEAGALAAAAQAPVPDSQLFWAGGDQSVRGYSLRDLGVAQTDGTLRPGRVMGVGSLEWQRPLLSNGQPTPWESTVFVDAGAVADRASDLRARVGVGAGVRMNSPAGPLQLDLAYGLTPKRWRIHFSVGLVF